MQKLILLLLLAPFGLLAQSKSEAKIAHQEAESQLMRRYPQAKKIDLEALSIQQKDAHKKCSTCGKNKAGTPARETSPKTMADLLYDQQRLTVIIKNLEENGSTDLVLLKKYKRALSSTSEKVKTLEQIQKRQEQIALKKAAR